MESASSFFSANPATATLLAIFVVVMLLFFILKKFLKLAIAIIFVLLLAGGVYLFKDPATMPKKIRESVETLKTGGEQIVEKLSSFASDTKKLAGKAKEVPTDINDMLDTAKKEVGK
jgi:hypothetical protein